MAPAVAGFLSILLVLWACAKPSPEPPPDYSAMRAKVDRVALAPLRSSADGVSDAAVAAAFEARATEYLVQAGLEVVAPAVWDAAWRSFAADVGGVYDASTGEVDEEKHETVQDAVRRAMVEEHGVDAVLYLHVRVTEHFLVTRHPISCGRAADPYWPTGWLPNDYNPATLVRILCLVGFLVEPGGAEYFARHAPIEGIETYTGQSRAVRPATALFRDEQQLDEAVKTVLEPFPPSGSPSEGAAAGTGPEPPDS